MPYAVCGLGVTGVVGQLLDIGVLVVPVVGLLLGAVAVVGDLRQALPPRRVLVRLGDFVGDLLVQDLARQAEVVEPGGFLLRAAGASPDGTTATFTYDK